LSAYAGSINLTGTSHDDSLVLHSLPAGVAMNLDLGAGNNAVYGPNTTNTWTINGANHAVLNGSCTISGIGGLAGGTAADRFVFIPGGSIGSTINGVGGGDTLDYTNYNGNVTVNLGAFGGGTYGSATGVGSSVSNIEIVLGTHQLASAGHPYVNVLTGSIYGNVLVGGLGNDTLTAYKGGTGRNVLIGGGGSDTINGGPNGDLIIGGTTSFDMNPTALNAIFAEWTSSDSYTDRVKFLSGPTGHYNGSYFLIPPGHTGQTVFDDGVPDTITPGNGMNWIIPS
jgi:hypothetical protein